MPLSDTEKRVLDACTGRAASIPAPSLPAVVEMAHRHEVGPIVGWRLLACLREAELESGLDEVYRSVLETANEIVARTVIQQRLEELEVAKAFEALGAVPAILFKGLSIAKRWYPTGTRSSRDMDISIERSDYPRAKSFLEDLGYRIVPMEDERIQLRQTKDVGFQRRDESGISWSVEIHVRLTEPGAPELDWHLVRDGSTAIDVAGQSVSVPSAEHTLLILALNLRKHRFARLKTFVDLDRLIEGEREALDWEELHRCAHTAGYCGLLRHTLALYSSMLGRPLIELPPCPRARRLSLSPSIRLLPTVATADTVFAEVRGEDGSKAFSGLIPFAALDKPAASLHLAYERLALGPELASYYRSQGEPGTAPYPSRIVYWRDIARRLGRARAALGQHDGSPVPPLPAQGTDVP